MARILLVRHGKAAAGWDQDLDSGLDATGRAQAEAMAAALAPRGPLPLLASPMRRTRETAAPLERLWSAALVEPAVSEVPSPSPNLAARRAWLDALMAGRWADVPELAAWRAGVLARLNGVERDTVVVSHYIAINVAVGAATGDDRVLCFRPDHCSVTELEADGRALRVVALGHEAATQVR
jgi:broad specificity phosphatase PhoE